MLDSLFYLSSSANYTNDLVHPRVSCHFIIPVDVFRHPVLPLASCRSLYNIVIFKIFRFSSLPRSKKRHAWFFVALGFSRTFDPFFSKNIFGSSSSAPKSTDSAIWQSQASIVLATMDCFKQIFRAIKAPFVRKEGRIVEIVRIHGTEPMRSRGRTNVTTDRDPLPISAKKNCPRASPMPSQS